MIPLRAITVLTAATKVMPAETCELSARLEVTFVACM